MRLGTCSAFISSRFFTPWALELWKSIGRYLLISPIRGPGRTARLGNVLSLNPNTSFFHRYLISWYRDLRKSLDAIRADTELQAEHHLLLAGELRSKFEVPTATFHARQLHHKKTRQAGVEKLFNAKLYKEFYFSKTRDIYEQECVRINVMEAQTTLVQGKELERISTKLERAKVVVHVKERGYANFLMALKETAMEWEQEWKSFCDTCQDMEEDRMNFMKGTFLNYANAVSTVRAAADTVRFLSLYIEQHLKHFRA